MSAISASAPAAILSCSVQVGERNISVSEMIAAQRSPAILGGISSFCSPYIWYMIVPVQPTGWLRKLIGCIVCSVPSLWWSMISMISALSILSTAWSFSLWSTRTTFFLCMSRKLRLEIVPIHLPFLLMTGNARWRCLIITSWISSVKSSVLNVTRLSVFMIYLTGILWLIRREIVKVSYGEEIMTISFSCASFSTFSVTSIPIPTMIQLTFCSIACRWSSSRLPMMTISFSSTYSFILSGLAVATIIFPWIKYPCALPSITFPPIVSAIRWYCVLALERR